MATFTNFLKLRKPERTNNVNVVNDINNNYDLIDNAVASTFGIVVNGKRSSMVASEGQYVILQNSTITGYTDGLYTAAQNIPANTDLNSTYLTAVSGGAVNALNGNIAILEKNSVQRPFDSVRWSTDKTAFSKTLENGTYLVIIDATNTTSANVSSVWLVGIGNSGSHIMPIAVSTDANRKGDISINGTDVLNVTPIANYGRFICIKLDSENQ